MLNVDATVSESTSLRPNRLLVSDLARRTAPVVDELRTAIDRVITSGWFVLGKEVQAFERSFAAFCGMQHAVGVASGTDALEVALRAVGVNGTGDTVVTVANAGGYATTAIRAIGATPVYVDVDATTLLMDLPALAAALTRVRPAAIVATHLYGQPLEMPAILELAGRTAIPVVEDCAQAHGATWQGRRCGSFGSAAAFSFYPTKNLGALGDGGAVVTDSPDLAGRVRSLRQYGWDQKYVSSSAGGRNSRLDEVQAAVLNQLLPRLDSWNERRRQIVLRYLAELRHPRVALPHRGAPGDVGHLFVIRAADRDTLRSHLAAAGVGTDVHYPVPDHRQPAFEQSVSLPVTEATCSQLLTLPCFPEMTDDDVRIVVEAVNSWPVILP